MERNIKIDWKFSFRESCGYKLYGIEVGSYIFCINLLYGNNAMLNAKSF